jgi:hypothetical protein
VTRLALAAGMPAQLEPREATTGQTVAPGVSWRERLGALLAPRAWRYVVPVLALVLVGAVSLIVLMRGTPKEGSTTIARRNTSETQRPQASQPEAHHASQNDNAATTAAPGVESGVVAPDANASAPNANAPLAREEIAANTQRGEVAQPVVAGAPLNDAAAPPPPAPATGAGAVARSVVQLPTPAATPMPVSDELTVASAQEAKTKSGEAAPALPKLEQKQGGFENRQYENRQREQISGPRRNEQARNARTNDMDDSRDRSDKKDGNLAATAPAPPPAATAAKRTRQSEADRRKEENRPAEDSERSGGARAGSAGETRTVAGRTFRRQGNAWFDTSYRAGQSYTTVRRNSEQFRALVADEPQLRRIADALGGEVTVVWKGRAYRIR